MQNDDVTRLLKLLEKTGYEAGPKEFRETLDKFKAHPEALAALRRGVARQGRGEDRGSYCENASPGYDRWWKKNQMLEKLDLEDDRAFLQAADPSALPQKQPSGGENLQQLREQVKELTERVSLLEKRVVRGPSLPPGKGPGA